MSPTFFRINSDEFLAKNILFSLPLYIQHQPYNVMTVAESSSQRYYTRKIYNKISNMYPTLRNMHVWTTFY